MRWRVGDFEGVRAWPRGENRGVEGDKSIGRSISMMSPTGGFGSCCRVFAVLVHDVQKSVGLSVMARSV
jgi:hypothetical protein